ncbi:HAMP domain-containing sensor histidine kinase [Bengtsoniella intestinalis]|uniref:sensor histidine kinase n=1 Tax=Bengtsoniella intestinalis TaxID=3073143 RepID=UPI00391F9E05
MIVRLRLKFVVVSMTLVTLVLLGVFCFFRVTVQTAMEVTGQAVLERVLHQPSTATTFSVQDGSVQLPYFTVSLFSSGDGYTAYVTGGTYDDLENTPVLTEIVSQCLAQEETNGTLPDYNLRYLKENTGFVEQIAFVDVSTLQAALDTTTVTVLQGGIVALLGLLALSCWLSSWVVRPVERAWQQQRQFLADASHELKTPLTVILSNAQLLDTLDLPDPAPRWVEHIHYESQRMKSLVEQMLTLARTDQMRTVAMSQVALWEVVTDSVLSFEPVAFEAGKPIDETIAPDVEVMGDGGKLRQMVSILLDNAIKYGAVGCPIVVTLSKTEKVAKLVVANQGNEIPPAQLKHLFERFYRADQSRGSQVGFGLGLSIADSIAKEHKATLKAESDETSTRFICTIPLKK